MLQIKFTDYGYDLSIKLIKEFHNLILSSIDINIAGIFKKDFNKIGGSKVITCSPFEVEDKLTNLIKKYYKSTENILIKISKFHSEFEAIHPFEDRNGRTSRMIFLFV